MFLLSTRLVRYNATLSERERREAEAKHAACMEHRSAILLQVGEQDRAMPRKPGGPLARRP